MNGSKLPSRDNRPRASDPQVNLRIIFPHDFLKLEGRRAGLHGEIFSAREE